MNKIKLILVKIYFWLNEYKFRYLKKVKFYDNKIKEIVIFRNENSLFKGQAIPLLNVIIIEESLFNEYSKKVQKFILEHEYAHIRAGWVFNLFLLPILLILEVSALSSMILVFFLMLLVIFKKVVIFLLVKYSILFLFLILLFGIVSWIIELHADLNSIKVIGLVNAKKAYKELLTKEKKESILKKIIIIITHPLKKLSIWIYEKFFT